MEVIPNTAFPFYSDVCARINPILAKMTSEVSSTEALNSNIFGRFFVSVADSFSGLLNTFIANAFKFTKKLKRSELREFVDSNRFKVRVVCSKYDDDEDLLEFPVAVPANMKVTYPEAVATILRIYQTLNALNTAKLVDKTLTDIFSGLSSGNADVLSSVDSAHKLISSIIKAVKPISEECHSNFTDNFTAKKAFSVAYGNPSVLRPMTQDLIDNEYRLQDVHELVKTIEHMESTLDGICSIADKVGVNIKRDDVNSLGEMAKEISLIFDSYGLATTRQMTIEHNHCININEIYKFVK